MPKGPQRVAPISRKVGKKAPIRRVTRLNTQTGITHDVRPTAADPTHLERAKWNIHDRSDQGDWT